jgi:protease I
MARIVFVVAPENFRDEEYFVPKGILESAGHEIVTASKVVGEINSFAGRTTESQMRVSDIEIDGFDGVVFVGGQGMIAYLHDSEMTSLAKRFFETNKLTSAICIAPAILANAGILKDKKVTGADGTGEAFATVGAIIVNQPVVVDGNIITANGPAAAEAFGNEILKNLTT